MAFTSYYDAGSGTSTATGTIWRVWSNSTAATDTTSDGVWTTWTTAATSATSSVTVACENGVWTAWCDETGEPVSVYAGPSIPAGLTEEEREQRRIQAEERAQQLEEENRTLKKKLKAANARAKKLLLQNLNKEQIKSFSRYKKFLVQAPSGRVYELRDGWAGNVEEIKDGKRIARFCIHPGIKVPNCDNLLAQKLMLETDEERFRKIANMTPLNMAV